MAVDPTRITESSYPDDSFFHVLEKYEELDPDYLIVSMSLSVLPPDVVSTFIDSLPEV